MSFQPPHTTSFSPGLRTLIPIVYAAWSDHVLTTSEVRTLWTEAAQLSFLTTADLARLRSWSDPLHPPRRALFKLWEVVCQSVASSLPPEEHTLTQLGLKLGGLEVEPADQARLFRLERGLGEINVATFAALFGTSTAAATANEIAQAGFSATALQRVLDGDYAQLRQRVLTILQDPAFQRHPMPVKEDYRAQVLEWCKALAQQGLGAYAYPAAYGGGGDMAAYAVIFENLAYHDISLTVKFGVQFGLWGGSIENLGTKRHHDKYLHATGTADLLGCFAMTETGHGSNVRGLETTATYDPETDEFVIHSPRYESGKEYIGNALHAELASVFAQLIVDGENHGVHALVVPLRDGEGNLLPGITVEDNGYKLGLNGVDNGRIWFEEVRVPRENLLDRFGRVDEQGRYDSPIDSPSRRFFTMLGTLVGGRVCVPRAGLSAAKKALAIAIRYGVQRRQFAPSALDPETPILDYPSHQRRLFPLLAKAYALHFALDKLGRRYANRREAEMREIETLAAGLKSYATWFTSEAIQECREACGGKGYLAENEFADLRADTDIFTTFEGDNTVLMQLVAKGLLTDYQQAFHEDGNLAVLRYLGDYLSTVVTEQNPLAIRNTDDDHLLGYDFQQTAFRFRERKLLHSLAQRLRAHIRDGRSSYQAGLICQTHMLALADAFVARYTLEAMQEAIVRVEAGPVQDRLVRLRQLYALQTIEEKRGWFLEQEYIAPAKSKAIRRLVDHLCSELRPDAVALVDAFGIPDGLLAAPIAV
jgi:acyl-CoA oxidase